MPPKEDPNTLDLDPDRYERANIPAGEPPKQDPVKRRRNFNEVFLGYDEKQAVVEALRCIHCPSPEPCILGCPVHNDIPRALMFIEQGDPVAGANVFRQTNNLPEVCGRICPQEVLCEGACTVAGYDKPVAIGKLEAYCSDYQRNHVGIPSREIAPATGKRVAVIGFGPAGLAVAEELRVLGHEIVVYDAWPRPGGLMVYGIPGFKLSKRIIDQKVAHLESLGIRFVGDTLVGQDVTVDELLQGNDAVFLGVGATHGNPARLPGEDLHGIYQATEFLVRGNVPVEDLPKNMRALPEFGPRIAVIGGGDTAMDCVRTAKRLQTQHGFPDGDVTVYYRRTENEMPGRAEERMHARQEGIQFEFLVSPVRFIGDTNGHVRQIEFEKMRLRARDVSGRPRPEPIPGSNYTVEAQVVVLALGYKVDPLLLKATPGVTGTKWGTVHVENEDDPMTARPGVFAAGDDVRGADLVVTATAAGRKAAYAMNAWLKYNSARTDIKTRRVLETLRV
ncbi:MAG: NAD(P)-dependent oxidoreductase [Chloroflexi bacterium]|nr:NAD(P)-dependent oxidoreductase [Chloroflexota bacterium]